MHRVYNFNPGTDNGNVTTVTDCQHSDRTQNFDYDSLNRIKDGYTTGSGTTTNNWGETYTIDAWGNLTTIAPYPGKHNSETLSQTATTQNRLTGFSYDAAGNMTQNGSVTYTYDAENRITATSGYSYVYDGDGERVIKCSGTYPSCATGTLYWRGNAPDALTELTFAGAASEEYTFFGGKRVARRDGTSVTVHYYFADHLGSTDLITGKDGGINKTSAYYPYGGEIAVNGSTYANNYKFTGKERDAESGLDMFGARYYGSSLGRFMTPDWAAKPTTVPYASFGDPQTLNLYGYVHNNPLFKADADGHCPQCLGALFGAAVGAVQILYQTGQAVITGQGSIPTNKEIAGKLLGGMIGGAIGGASSGSILTNVVTKGGVEVAGATVTQQVVQGATGAVIGGIAERSVTTGDANRAMNGTAMATDAVVGGVSAGTGAQLTGSSSLAHTTEALTDSYASPSATGLDASANNLTGSWARNGAAQLDNAAAANGAATGTAASAAQTATEKKKRESQ